MVENSVIDRTRKLLVIGITLLLIAIILFWASSVIRKPFSSQKEMFTVEVYQGSVGEGFAYSNLHPPTQLEAKNITSSSITITWNFEEKILNAKRCLDSEYADHSGFRIYRDDYWYTDVQSNKTSITDTILFPGESYKYKLFLLLQE